MLDFPGTCVAGDSEIAEEIKEKNQRYEEVCSGVLSYNTALSCDCYFHNNVVFFQLTFK